MCGRKSGDTAKGRHPSLNDVPIFLSDYVTSPFIDKKKKWGHHVMVAAASFSNCPHFSLSPPNPVIPAQAGIQSATISDTLTYCETTFLIDNKTHTDVWPENWGHPEAAASVI